jgi:hypothetical protein
MALPETIVDPALRRKSELLAAVAAIEAGGGGGGGGAPTGAAGGVLAGTYPNPTLASGSGGQIVKNVIDFGADPTGVASSTTAIQNAINALPVTGGIVYFPAGNYRINTTIFIGDGSASGCSTRAGVILRGCSPAGQWPTSGSFVNPNGVQGGTSRLFAQAGTGIMLAVRGPLQGWGIQNLHFDGLSLATCGIDEIATLCGDSYNCCFTGFINFAQRTRSLDNVGALLNVGPNHAYNRYIRFSYGVPNINNTMAVLADSNGAGHASTDSFGDTWEDAVVVFSPMSAGVTSYGFYFRGADNDRVRNATFGVTGTSTAPGKYVAVYFDYGGDWPNMPQDCRVESVDFGFSRQVGTPPPNCVGQNGAPVGWAAPNRISEVSEANASPGNPGLPNLIWENVYPITVKSVAGSGDVTLSAHELISDAITFTGAIGANIAVIVSNASGRPYRIFNNTSGAFTLTVKGPTGTGVVVGTGKRAMLLADGTNINRLAADV